jgi:hypothetical protein
MDVQQDELMQIINRNFWGVALRKTGVIFFCNIGNTINEVFSRVPFKISRPVRHTPRFAPAGQSTQMIIWGNPDDDNRILHLANALYGR